MKYLQNIPIILRKLTSINIALVAALCAVLATPNVTFASDRDDREERRDRDDRDDRRNNDFAGVVYAMTNQAEKNEVVVYRRATDGTLTLRRSVDTRGLGIGVDTDTQGALRLGPNNRFLYATNPGSDTITVFRIKGDNLKVIQVIPAGDQPQSISIAGDLLYVLDSSVAGNGIQGFRINSNGTLTSLEGSFRDLSSPVAVPGEVRFDSTGNFLYVTQKTTNELMTPRNAIDVFTIDAAGFASPAPFREASFGLRPFSMDVTDSGFAVVVEAFNAGLGLSSTSSYRINNDGSLTVISGSIPNFGTDVCWVSITDDARYAYTSNFGSGDISSYSLSPTGELTLLEARAATPGDTTQPVDSLYVDGGEGGDFLYQMLRRTGEIAAYIVEDDGSLTPNGVTGGLTVDNGISGMTGF